MKIGLLTTTLPIKIKKTVNNSKMLKLIKNGKEIEVPKNHLVNLKKKASLKLLLLLRHQMLIIGMFRNLGVLMAKNNFV